MLWSAIVVMPQGDDSEQAVMNITWKICQLPDLVLLSINPVDCMGMVSMCKSMNLY